MKANLIAPSIHEGELRILDTDLATRLGFDRPRDIRKLIKRYEAELDRMGVCATVTQTPGETGGRPGKSYYLNKKQAIFITAKSETPEATEITIEIIEKFDSYERGEIAKPTAPAIPQTYAEALIEAGRLAYENEERKAEIERQKALIDAAVPKVIVHDRIYRAHGSLNITEAAKALNVGPKTLFRWLSTHEWIYRRAGGKSWLGYQRYVSAGYLEHKVTPLQHNDGTEKLSEQVRITGKGLAKLATLVPGSALDPAFVPPVENLRRSPEGVPETPTPALT